MDTQKPMKPDHAITTTDNGRGGLLSELEPEKREAVAPLLQELDQEGGNAILFFGSKVQQELTEISDSMLEGVRNKDAGPASASLNEIVAMLRGFGGEDLTKKPGLLSRLKGQSTPLVKFLQRYDTVRGQIDELTNRLEQHETTLMTDVVMLDRLYDTSLKYFHSLEYYILAGQEKLRQFDEELIPAATEQAERSDAMLSSQNLADLRGTRDELERRVHDLRLTRQVTMQALPSIRLVQENDKGLVQKIQSTVVNTIPLWRQQLAQAITLFRSSEAAKTVAAANDLTNNLLEQNAQNLKQANRDVRKQIERGIFDIEVVKRANDTLIETIEESLQIAEEGKTRRAAAISELEACETQLRQALGAAQAKQQ